MATYTSKFLNLGRDLLNKLPDAETTFKQSAKFALGAAIGYTFGPAIIGATGVNAAAHVAQYAPGALTYLPTATQFSALVAGTASALNDAVLPTLSFVAAAYSAPSVGGASFGGLVSSTGVKVLAGGVTGALSLIAPEQAGATGQKAVNAGKALYQKAATYVGGIWNAIKAKVPGAGAAPAPAVPGAAPAAPAVPGAGAAAVPGAGAAAVPASQESRCKRGVAWLKNEVLKPLLETSRVEQGILLSMSAIGVYSGGIIPSLVVGIPTIMAASQFVSRPEEPPVIPQTHFEASGEALPKATPYRVVPKLAPDTQLETRDRPIGMPWKDGTGSLGVVLQSLLREPEVMKGLPKKIAEMSNEHDLFGIRKSEDQRTVIRSSLDSIVSDPNLVKGDLEASKTKREVAFGIGQILRKGDALNNGELIALLSRLEQLKEGGWPAQMTAQNRANATKLLGLLQLYVVAQQTRPTLGPAVFGTAIKAFSNLVGSNREGTRIFAPGCVYQVLQAILPGKVAGGPHSPQNSDQEFFVEMLPAPQSEEDLHPKIQRKIPSTTNKDYVYVPATIFVQQPTSDHPIAFVIGRDGKQSWECNSFEDADGDKVQQRQTRAVLEDDRSLARKFGTAIVWKRVLKPKILGIF